MEELNQEYKAFLKAHKNEAAAVEEEALEADANRVQEAADSRKLDSGAAVDLRTYKSGINGRAVQVGGKLLAVEQIDEIEEQRRIAKENSDWLVTATNKMGILVRSVENLQDRVDEIKISLDWLKKGNLKRQLLDLRKRMEEEQRWLRTKMEPSSPGLDEEEKNRAEIRIADIGTEIYSLESHFSKLGI